MAQTGFWQARAGHELLWRSWGDEYVVYHCGSGDTHLLDAAAARLLRRLLEAPEAASSLELSGLVAETLLMSSEESLEYTSELLEELQRLMLVERVRGCG